MLRIPIAHGEGNYYAEPDVIARVSSTNRQIVFRYCDAARTSPTRRNPNGSLDNIAGICNDAAERRRPDAAPGARVRVGARQRRRARALRLGHRFTGSAREPCVVRDGA